MTRRDFSPINVGGKVLPPPARICPQLLEPARVQPCYEGADDQAEWMHNGGREVIARKLAEVARHG